MKSAANLRNSPFGFPYTLVNFQTHTGLEFSCASHGRGNHVSVVAVNRAYFHSFHALEGAVLLNDQQQEHECFELVLNHVHIGVSAESAVDVLQQLENYKVIFVNTMLLFCASIDSQNKYFEIKPTYIIFLIRLNRFISQRKTISYSSEDTLLIFCNCTITFRL